MKKFLAKHVLLRKYLVTLLILLVFTAGRHLPLPKVLIEDYVNLNPFLDTAISLTGGSLSQIGLFSLGLAPMMYSSLLVQLSLLGKRHLIVSPKLFEFRKNMLMLVIALIQGLGLAVNLHYGGGEPFLVQVFQVTLVLITGAFVINWLGNMNAAYGLGGPIVIMLASILSNQMRALPVVVDLWQSGKVALVLAFGFWGLLTVFFSVFFEWSEYRIPIQRMSIHNNYAKDSYLPIKVNIAGGMPIMYAYSLMAFPQYFLFLLAALFPKLSNLSGLNTYFMMTNLSGVLMYFLVLTVLTLVMAFVTVDVTSMAEGMRQAGDYIPYIRTGKPTQAYLSRYVRFFAWFNALYLVVLTGLPLLVSLIIPETRPLAGLSGIFMMTAGMLMGIREELRVRRLKKSYRSLFD